MNDDPLINRKNGSFQGLLFIIAIYFLTVWGTETATAVNIILQKQSDGSSNIDSGILPMGWVTYMKSGGIYLKQLGRKEDRLLVNEGSYPRWSPDGKSIAFVQNKKIGLVSVKSGRIDILAKPKSPRAVAFHPNGNAVWYTDGKSILSVDITSRKIKQIISGKKYLELDCAKNGDLIAVTVKEKFGYYVYVINTGNNTVKKISRGCSASLSPDGRQITVNGSKHFKLGLFDTESGDKIADIDAPPKLKFDNQFWSNHQDWIASLSDGERTDVHIHRISSNRSWAITRGGGCDRPDLFIVE